MRIVRPVCGAAVTFSLRPRPRHCSTTSTNSGWRPSGSASTNRTCGNRDGERVACRGQVFDDVNARREEVRQQDHVRRAGFDALRTAGLDVRFGQFQVRHLHDGVRARVRAAPTRRTPGRRSLRAGGCRARSEEGGLQAPRQPLPRGEWLIRLPLPSQGRGLGGLGLLPYTTPMIGARVGNWYVEAEIGRGPLGVVYRARGYDDPERHAAVKVFTETRDPAAVQRFARRDAPASAARPRQHRQGVRQRHPRRAGVRRLRTGRRHRLREVARRRAAAVARGALRRGAGGPRTQARPQPQRPPPRPQAGALHPHAPTAR